MACIIDMICDSCESIFEYDKVSIVSDTPKKIKCPKCGGIKTHRLYSILATDVGEGLCGNAKNGYQKGVTYHRSQLSSGKGTRV